MLAIQQLGRVAAMEVRRFDRVHSCRQQIDRTNGTFLLTCIASLENLRAVEDFVP